MVKEEFTMRTELVSDEDGRHTYEVSRIWDESKRKGLVLELYPTLSLGRTGELDLSSIHLLNHSMELGWGGVRVINLYSAVCDNGKPSVSQLSYDDENMAYIEDVLESSDIEDYDIVIATGNTLSNHAVTTEIRSDIFAMLLEKGLERQVFRITVEGLDTDKMPCVHPLYVGLHYGKERWRLEPFDLRQELSAVRDTKDGKEGRDEYPSKSVEDKIGEALSDQLPDKKEEVVSTKTKGRKKKGTEKAAKKGCEEQDG